MLIIFNNDLLQLPNIRLMKNDEASILVRLGVAANVRAIRKECGHTQTNFAEMINVNRSYISQIERGKGNISIDVLVKIADGLDRPITDFFRGLESGSPRALAQKSVDYEVVALPEEQDEDLAPKKKKRKQPKKNARASAK